MNMEKNKKILWGIIAIVLLAAAFMLGQERGWNQGTANTLDVMGDYIYPPEYSIPPADPYADYVPPTTDYIYPPTDPIYPPMP